MAEFKGITVRIGPNGNIKRFKTVKIPSEKYTHVRFDPDFGLCIMYEGQTVLFVSSKNLIFWRRNE